MSLASFLYSQLIRRLPYPSGSHADQTVIVTGSNVGLGKEAARHFARLHAKKVILAVRSLEKGQAAKEEIESSLRDAGGADGPTEVQVWQLDMASYASVEKFAARVDSELSRVDVLVANAGIAPGSYYTAEGNESMMTVNVVSTFLLAALVLPKMKESARRFGIRPTLTITSSGVHAAAADLVTRAAAAGELWPLVNDRQTVETRFAMQYPASKLLEIFGVRAIGEQSPAAKFPVTVNCVNPGLCHSELGRDYPTWGFWFLKLVLARSAEVGSRNLVAAASMGQESHGKYVSDCVVTEPSAFLGSEDGRKVQKMFWGELTQKLEEIKPGVAGNFL
ncbi:short-chain dehydrogenase, putative [Metarhizium acridum CQMa 102]|uniref:Short-chain dehydrogenase, putative n=1 Tax=Metarhizium acridum (strain CQMa 102) TaxID=655827 RepID=E9E5S1_METAQ|nr:short-chain dehydrogenase, putative [Metarhizium acridum CQMa 102]EFY88784.1 short-chain dehydrogenase, putative [Metarhizium acridum CQMa 102]